MTHYVIHNHFGRKARDSRQPFPNETPEMRKRILEIRRLLQQGPGREEARKLEDELHDLMSKAMRPNFDTGGFKQNQIVTLRNAQPLPSGKSVKLRGRITYVHPNGKIELKIITPGLYEGGYKTVSENELEGNGANDSIKSGAFYEHKRAPTTVSRDEEERNRTRMYRDTGITWVARDKRRRK